MLRLIRPGLVAVLLIAGLPLRAADLEPLNVAVGLSLPPYVMADEKRGMEYDIVREALADAGYELVPVFMDFGDVLGSLADKDVDAAMTIPGDLDLPLSLSQTHITYHNAAITLESSGITIDTMSDLEGRSIMAFQNARAYLDETYRQATADNPGYTEKAEQYRQDLALYSGSVEIVVADINIFTWFARDARVTSLTDADQPVVFHRIFAPTPYHVAFHDTAIRDAFDAALRAMRDDGRYDAIIQSYGGQQ